MKFSFAKHTHINGNQPKTKGPVKTVDPRIAVSSHIGWRRAIKGLTEFSTPEPDNYNHAVFAEKPIACPLPFVENQIWYKAVKRRDLRGLRHGWWSLYIVPPEHLAEFRTWLHTLSVDTYWYAPRYVPTRERRSLLWAKRNQAEITENERLYIDGYYETFRTKYFSDDNKMFDSRVGVPRENLYEAVLVEDTESLL